ncbi:MAG: thymidylate synthase [Bacteroidales bacterium]
MKKKDFNSITFTSVDEMLQEGLRQAKNGVYRKPLNQASRCGCMEVSTPVALTLNNPLSRFITLKNRKANTALTVAESVWILSGMNDLDALPANYAKAIYKYADDGKSYRAGYGPRIRFYNDSKLQYNISTHERLSYLERGSGFIDQFKFCVEQLKKDKFNRQAVITIHDPIKDDFDLNGDLLKTKDTPCTRSIQFMCDDEGRLCCYVHMRSNDIIHGMSVINVAEFTFLQQILAQICGFPLGNYYHIANNFHYYEDMDEMAEKCLSEKIQPIPEMDTFAYEQKSIDLSDVDRAIDIFLAYESSLRRGQSLNEKNPFYTENRLQVFSDYAEVLRLFQCKKQNVDSVCGEFFHPQLQIMHQRGLI